MHESTLLSSKGEGKERAMDNFLKETKTQVFKLHILLNEI